MLPRYPACVCVCTLVSLNLVMRRPSLCCVLVVHVVATHRKSATLLGVQFELYFCQSTERRELPLHHRSLIVICRRLVKRCRNISRLVYIIHLAPFITIYRYRYRENGSEIIARKILCLSPLPSSPPGNRQSNLIISRSLFQLRNLPRYLCFQLDLKFLLLPAERVR